MDLLRARDIMTENVVTVGPDTSLPRLEELFAAEHVSGFPVVEDGALVGVVSRADIVRQLWIERSVAVVRSGFYSGGAEAEDSRVPFSKVAERIGTSLETLRVRDLMVASLVTVTPDSPVRDIANVLIGQRIHRVLVADGTRLRGIVTTFDVVRLIAEVVDDQR